MHDIVFVAAKRTAFGKLGGSLSHLSATDLGVLASQAAIAQAGMEPSKIDHVVFGNVIQSSSDAAYLARHVGLRAGVPQKSPALTVNRLCGSGFEAIIEGVRLIRCEEATTVLVGGAENMSQAPYVLRDARFGYRLGDGKLEDSLMSGLTDSYAGIPMAETAERLAAKYSISRKDVDEYALRSQSMAGSATENGTFDQEIVPVEVTRGRNTFTFRHDEHIRKEATFEALSKLKPAFKKEGLVTAGNASGICDGAAALILTTLSEAKKNGWTVLGTWEGHYTCGVDPTLMGIGPAESTKGLMKKYNYSLNDFELIEVNEAFSAQYLAVEKELGLDRAKTNVHGGAIAIGHPLAASGARLTVHLLYALAKNQLGMASACIGGGQGTSVALRV